MTNCIFCKIVKKEIPANILWENEEFVCFLDINPYSKGHALIIPKKHYKKVIDMPTKLFQKAAKLQLETTQKLTKVLNADSFNLFVIGEDVDHAHFHILPRYKNDDTKIDIKKTQDQSAKNFQQIINTYNEK